MSPSPRHSKSAPAEIHPISSPLRWGSDSSPPIPSGATKPARLASGSRKRSPPTAPRPATDAPCELILIGASALARQSYFPALEALQQSGALIVRAIVEPHGSGLDAASAAFPAAMAVESIDAVTNSPDAIALIATPPRFHLSQVNAALKRGWHVLCSTPLTPNAAEAATMIASAQRHERLLAVDLRTRLFPAALYLREVCRDHLLGPPLSFRMDVGQTHRATDDVSKTEKLEHAHGVLADLGAPILDLLTWCFGSAGVVSYADDAMGGAEATAVIELEFRDGVRGTVHLSRDWPTEDAGTFVFERGIVRWTAHRPAAVTLQIASAPFAIAGELTAPLSAVRATPTAAPLATDASACASQLENLIAAIAGRSALRMPATEAMHSLPLIDDCYARRSPLPQPWLSPNDAVHARALSPPPMVRRA